MNKKNHMSYFGVGPIYVMLTFIFTVIAVYIGKLQYFSIGIIQIMKISLIILGVVLIVLGIILWVQAVIISKIDKNITENKLVTTGAYAWVRNPIYSAFTIVFTGILCLQNNLILLVFPLIYWFVFEYNCKKRREYIRKNIWTRIFDI